MDTAHYWTSGAPVGHRLTFNISWYILAILSMEIEATKLIFPIFIFYIIPDADICFTPEFNHEIKHEISSLVHNKEISPEVNTREDKLCTIVHTQLRWIRWAVILIVPYLIWLNQISARKCELSNSLIGRESENDIRICCSLYWYLPIAGFNVIRYQIKGNPMRYTKVYPIW